MPASHEREVQQYVLVDWRKLNVSAPCARTVLLLDNATDAVDLQIFGWKNEISISKIG
jgi:hypothetical protein